MRSRTPFLLALMGVAAQFSFGQTIQTTPNPSVVGQSVLITASATTGVGTMIPIEDLGTNVVVATVQTTSTLHGGGSVGSTTISTLSAGSHQLQGCVNLIDTYQCGNIVTQVVNKVQTSVLVTPSPSQANVQQTVTLTAMVTPSAATGTVTFSAGSTTISTVNLSNGSASVGATFGGPGTYTITANYNGDSTYAQSSGTAQVIINQPQTQTQTFLNTAPNPSDYGQPVIATATVNPSSATGTVSFLADGAVIQGSPFPLSNGSASVQINGLAVGIHSLSASFNGNTSYSSSTSQTVNQTVNRATPIVSLSVQPSPVTYGSAVSLTAMITPSTATGNVTFFDGSNSLGTAVVSGGAAYLVISTNPFLQPGNHSLTASYSGDGNLKGATSVAVQETVNPGTTTPQPTFTSLTASPTNVTAGQPVTLTATVSPAAATGTISFFDGSSLLANSPLTGGAAIFTTSSLSVGNHSLTASYGGSTNYATSNSSPASVTVTSSGGTNPPSCTFSLSAGSASVGAAASTGSVQVTAPAGCIYTASSPSGSFVSITSGASGSGNGTVTYSVQANSGTTARSTGLTIAGLPFTVNQLNGCVFGLTPSSASFAAAGGTALINVGASNSNCGFTAVSNNPSFIVVNGSGSPVSYTVLPNSSGSGRAGSITVAGQSFTVVQAGTACSFALAQASQSFTSAGGMGTASVQAPAGCSWTAQSNSSFVTITGGASGSGNGMVSYAVQPNPTSALRVGSLTIAGLPYAVTESGSSPLTCTASVPAATNVAIEGRTEVMGDLLLSCTGLTSPLTADISFTLNTNVTNALTNGVTDASLVVNGASQAGLVSGYNTLTWLAVPLAPAAGAVQVRITNVRADASLLGTAASLQSIPVTGVVTVSSTVPVPVVNASQTLAFAAPTFTFQRMAATGSGTQTIIPLQYQEAGIAAFQSGSNATRLRMVISGVPAGVQVLAPLFPNEGTRAQLFSADANGLGGSAVAGAPGSYQQLVVSGGVATATWVVLSADPTQFENDTFALMLQNPSAQNLSQVQISASLGPVSTVSVASATAPVPRYRDFSVPQSLVNLRATSTVQVVTSSQSLFSDHAKTALVVGPKVMVTTQVANDTQDNMATGVTIGSKFTGGMMTSCQTSMGSCTMSGDQGMVNVGNLPPGGSVQVVVTVAPTACGSSICEVGSDSGAASDQPNADLSASRAGTVFIVTGGSSSGGAANLAASGGTPQSVRVGAPFPAPLQVTVTDASGNPVSNQTVTFTAPSSGASAGLSSSTAQTNVSGVASVTATANGIAGSYTVVAATGGLTASFSLTNVAQATNGDLAQGQPASQSSTLPGTPPASAAADGNTDGAFFDGSVTATNLDSNPWWQVDLGASTAISKITIWNRTDCCGSRLGDYWVFVSDTPFLATDTPATLQFRAGTFSSHQTTAPNPSASITNSAQGRYVRVQLSSAGYLSLAEVQVFGASGGTGAMVAAQSSTLPGTPSASVAIDGNTDGSFFDGSVTATNLEANPWWQVDLGASATISVITVWNRTDCCGSRLSDYWVFVSDTPFLAADTPATLQFRSGTFASHQTTAPNPSTTISVNATGRYVRVQLSSANYLSLAEVQITRAGGGSSTDLAQGKTATQSSTLPGTPTASAAADGNTDGAFFDGSVTATNLDPSAWWQVDLGASTTVGSVVVWNRTDCCASRLGDYWVFVSDTPFLATDTPATLQFRSGTFASHLTTAPNPSSTILVNATGRYVRVQLSGTGYLSLAEVQVFGASGNPANGNLALSKTASQSSTLPGTPSAGVAVDGNTDGAFFDGSVTATNADPAAWWQVDLGATANVSSVVVWNRTDCCAQRLNDYWVFVSNTPFLATDTPATLAFRAGTFASHQITAPSPSTSISVGAPGRYVRIQLTGTNNLSLAEVQVFGQ